MENFDSLQDFILVKDENGISILRESNFIEEKIYGCSFKEETKNRSCFNVSGQKDNKKISKRFSYYNSKQKIHRVMCTRDNAFIVAQQFRNKLSDELGSTKITTKIKEVPIKLREWMVGFFDGDGCIRQKGSKTNVSVSQSSSDENPPPSLLVFKICFGGTLYSNTRKGRDHCKPEWQWKIFGKESIAILQMIVQYGILKVPQAKLALEALSKDTNKSIDAQNIILSKKDGKYYTKLITAAKKEYDTIPIDDTKLTPEFIWGFFNAEGCIQNGTDTTAVTIKFTQFNSTTILDAIKVKLGNIGTVKFGRLLICGENAINVLKKMQFYLLEKKPQCDLMLEHREEVKLRRKRPRTEEEISDDLEVENRCKRLKKYHDEIECED